MTCLTSMPEESREVASADTQTCVSSNRDAAASSSKTKPVKVKTKVSREPMRWAADDDSSPHRAPGPYGNDFDVRMSAEPDGVIATAKVVSSIVRSGVCLVEANAPAELQHAAFDEAEQLWSDGEFTPPLRVHDDRSMMEARLWKQALNDEEKVVWISRLSEKKSTKVNALKLLANNMSDFAAGLTQRLESETGLRFDRIAQPMLSCYTGNRTYDLHVDNPHKGGADEQRPPDNGMRLTITYFLNTCWDPTEHASCEGGLDVHLTGSPEVASSATKLRIAPHSDTLAILLSEQIAHRVIATKGSGRWFCLTTWGILGSAMDELPRKLADLNRTPEAEDSDD